jgi:hypothetical protein
MSAWIVSKTHIDALVRAGIRAHIIDPTDSMGTDGFGYTGKKGPTDWGRLLWLENLRSVQHRYPRENSTELPGPCPTPFPDAYDFAGNYHMPILPAVNVLKAIACYEYQSCEHPGWEDSEAHRFCQALKNAAITWLPGYDSAPWGIDS